MDICLTFKNYPILRTKQYIFIAANEEENRLQAICNNICNSHVDKETKQIDKDGIQNRTVV